MKCSKCKWYPSETRRPAYAQGAPQPSGAPCPEPPDRRGRSIQMIQKNGHAYEVTMTTLVGKDTITVTFAMNVCSRPSSVQNAIAALLRPGLCDDDERGEPTNEMPTWLSTASGSARWMPFFF